MDLEQVMDEVAGRLKQIPDFLSVSPHPADSVTVPAAVVGYPEVEFHTTYARGSDRMTLPIWVLVGRVSEQAARAKMAPWLSGSGSRAVLAVLEASGYTSLDSLTVQRAVPDTITVGTTDYLAAMFECDIIGQGG